MQLFFKWNKHIYFIYVTDILCYYVWYYTLLQSQFITMWIYVHAWNTHLLYVMFKYAQPNSIVNCACFTHFLNFSLSGTIWGCTLTILVISNLSHYSDVAPNLLTHASTGFVFYPMLEHQAHAGCWRITFVNASIQFFNKCNCDVIM